MKLQKRTVKKIAISFLLLLVFLQIIFSGIIKNDFTHMQTAHASWYSTGGTWSYRKALKIDHTKVPNSNQANFPVLVSFTDASLKTTANGGRVQSGSGYDINFISSDNLTPLSFEIEKYVPATGEIEAWVKIPSLSYTTDTVFYMYYGNSSISSSLENKTAVWDDGGLNYYKGVWHMRETGTGVAGDYKDSTASANNSTNTAGQPTYYTSGQIDGAENFNGSSTKIALGDTGANPSTSSMTFSAWIKMNNTSGGTTNPRIFSENIDDNNAWQILTGSTSTQDGHFSIAFFSGGVEKSITSTATYSLTPWYLITGVWNGSSVSLYSNGALITTTAASGFTKGTADAKAYIGMRSDAAGYLNGYVDEVRVSNTVRSADWIKTEFNNQSSPSTFITSGIEEGVYPTAFSQWGFRKGITVTNNVGTAYTGYQTQLTVDTASLIASGKMLSNCNDMRFGETDGTNIPYWIESGCNTASTIVWVKTNLAISGVKNIYMYYGNSSVPAASSGANTFIKYSDANDAASWTGVGMTQSGGELHAAFAADGCATLPASLSFPWVVEAEIRSNYSVSVPAFVIGNGMGATMASTRNVVDWATGTSYVATNSQLSVYNSYAVGTTYIHKAVEVAASNYNHYIYNTSRTLLGSRTGTSYGITGQVNPTISIQLCNANSLHSADLYVAWVFARQYASTEPTIAVGAEDMNIVPVMQYFTVSGTSSQTAGNSQTLTITAMGSNGSAFTSYSGDKSITLSGANGAGSYIPTCTDKNGSDIQFGNPTTLTFTNGVATCSLKLYKAETADINISDGIYNANNHLLSIGVIGNVLNSFSITSPATVLTTVPFSMTVVGKDVYGNSTSNVLNTTTFSLDRGTISPNSFAPGFNAPDSNVYSGEKDITITNSNASVLTGYQVRINLDTASLIAAGNMQSDCDDIRFSEADNVTSIPYWIESGCNTNNTIVWIKTNLSASSSKTVYMYYGNSNVSSTADGNSVFNFFDDFNGSSLDATKWTPNGGTITESGGILNYTYTTSGGYLTGKTTFGTNTALRARLKSAHNNSSYNEYLKYGDSSYGLFALYSSTSWPNDYNNSSSSGGVTSPIIGWAADTYGVQDIIRNASTNAIYKVNDGNQVVISSSLPTNTDFSPMFYLNTAGASISADWLLVRQYTATEPTAVVQANSSRYSGTYIGNFTISGVTSAGNDTLTVQSGSVSATANPYVDIMDHFAITGASTQNAGTSQTITITAAGLSGTTYTPYTGDKTITFSGANAIGSYIPTCTNKSAADVQFGQPTTLTFTNGVATCNLKLYNSESANINASDGTYNGTGHTLSVAVSSLAVNTLNASIASSITAGSAQLLTLAAKDTYGNNAAAYTGDKTITFSGTSAVGSYNPTASDKNSSDVNFGTGTTITFNGGVATSTIKLYRAETFTFVANDGTRSATQTIAVSPAVLSGLNVTAPSTVAKDIPFSMTIVAKDQYGNGTSNMSGNASISLDHGTISPGSMTPSQFQGFIGPDSNLYNNEKDITITNSTASTLTDYQVRLNLDTASLIAAGKMQSDCDDMRFAEIGNANIPYWIENDGAGTGCGTNNTIVWIKTAIPASASKNIYFYYGNTSVSSAADGNSVFDLFDDFNGSTLDANKWTVTGSVGSTTVSGGIMTNIGGSRTVTSKASFGTNYAVRSRLASGHFGSSTNQELLVFTGTNGGASAEYYGGGACPMKYISTIGSNYICPTSITGWAANVYAVQDIIRNSTTNVIFKVNDANQVTLSSYVYTGGDSSVKFSLFSSPTTMYTDWVLVRKYISSEPTAVLQSYGNSMSSGSYIGNFTISGVSQSGNNTITVQNNGISGTANVFIDSMDHFTVTGSGSQNAGASQAIALTAIWGSGGTYTSYSGDHAVTFSGAGSVGSYVPSCTDKTGADIPFGSPATLTFTNGVATCNLKLYKAETANIGVTDGTFNANGNTLSVNVSSQIASMHIDAPAPAIAGTPLSVTLSAKDIFGNTVAGYGGDKTITFSGATSIGSYIPTASDKNSNDINFGTGVTVTFNSGVGTTNLKLYKSEIINLVATDGTFPATANISVSPGQLTRFDVNAPASVSSGYPFSMTVAARDIYGNIITNVNGTTALSLDRGSISPDSIAASRFQSYVGPDSNLYSYEKDITINNADTSILTGYEVRLTLDTASLIAAGKMQSDCDDMRFAETTNANIPYWIESDCNSAATIVWIKTNLSASSSKNIYFYYGNASVSSASDGNSVFDFFDDFNGSSLDANKWDILNAEYGTDTVSGGVLTVASNIATGGMANSYSVGSKATFGTNYAVRARVKSSGTSTQHQDLLFTNSSITNSNLYGLGSFYGYSDIGSPGSMVYYQANATSSNRVAMTGWANNTYGVQDIIRNGTTSGIFKVNDANAVTVSTYIYTGTDSKVRFRVFGTGASVIADWVSVRKYNAVEPTATPQSSGSSQFFGACLGIYTISGISEVGNVVLTVQNGDAVGTATIYADAFDHFSVTGAGTQNAGASQTITITATGNSGSAFSAYTGDKTITLSGASSVGSYVPTCTDKTGADIPLGNATTLAFTNGVATCNLKLYKVEVADINVSDGTDDATGYTQTISVFPLAINHFNINTPGNLVSGSTAQFAISARDIYGNLASAYTGDKNITFSGAGTVGTNQPTVSDKSGSDIPFGSAATLTFTSGLASGNLKLYKVETAIINASDGTYNANGHTANVNVTISTLSSFTVNAPATITLGSFPLTIIGKDSFGNIVSSIAGDTNLSVDKGTIGTTSIPSSGFQSYIGPDTNPYTNEKDISINNNVASALTGYQVKLIINTASLISAGKMQSDCDDMRFGETDNTNIPYWLESGCNTASTIVWIKTNLSASATKTVYMYYGNSGVASAANGSSVFELFDDFSGSAIDANKWDVTGTGTTTLGGGIVTATDTSSGYYTLKSKTAFGTNTAVRARVNSGHYNSSNYEYLTFAAADGASKGLSALYSNPSYAHKYFISNGSNSMTSSILGWTAGSYGVQDIIRNSTTSGIFKVNDGNQVTVSSYIYSGSDCKVQLQDYGSGSAMSADWILVRKYAGTEPTVTVQTTSSNTNYAGVYFGNINISGINRSGSVTLTVQNGGIVQTANIFIDMMDHFAITGSGTQDAGSGQTITINAMGGSENVFSLYAGDHAVTLSGAGSIGSYVPSCTDKTGADIPFGSPATLTFTNGVATCNLKLYKSETASIGASDATYDADGHKLDVVVSSHSSRFNLDLPEDATAGSSFPATITALDTFGNSATDYSGVHDITLSGAGSMGGSYVPTCGDVPFGSQVQLDFANGVAHCNLKLYKAETANVTVSDGTLSSSKGVTVAPAQFNNFFLSAPNHTASGAPFKLSFVARDAYGNVTTDVNDDTSINVNHGTINSPNIPASDFHSYVGPDGNNYSDQKDVVISNSTDTILDDHQVKIILDTSALIAAGKLQNSCADLRFSDTSGENIPYMIESGCRTQNTSVWIKTDLPASADKTIYMYYGNNAAQSAEDAGEFDLQNVDTLSTSQVLSSGSDGVHAFSLTINGIVQETTVALTVHSGGFTQVLNLDVTGVDQMDHFVISGSSAETAGQTQRITITAVGKSGYPYVLYSGDRTLRFSGADSQSGHAPTCDGVNFGDDTELDFQAGVAVCDLKLYKAGEADLTATDGTYSADSNRLGVNVTHGALAGFDIYSPDNYASESPFSIAVMARDAYDNAVADPGEATSVSVDHGTINLTSIDSSGFAKGAYTDDNVVISGIYANTSVTVTFTNAGISSSKNINMTGIDYMDHLSLSANDTQVAGSGQTLTVTAVGRSGNTFQGYSGEKSVVFSGAEAIGNNHPRCSGVNFGDATTLNFVNGVATCTLNLYKTGTPTISLTESTYSASKVITVSPSQLSTSMHPIRPFLKVLFP